VTDEGRKMGQSSEVPSSGLVMPEIEKAEAKKLLTRLRE
jgi:hypothetical protein